MSDSSVLVSLPPVKEMKAAKKKTITLPPMLANASTKEVVLKEDIDKVSLEAVQRGGKSLMPAKCIFGIDFEMLKADQSCLLFLSIIV
jgi:hypothetical protein